MIWPLLFFSKIANSLAKNSKWVALITAFLLWLNDLIEKTINFVMVQLKELIDSLNITALTDISLGSLEGVGYVNALFPVSELVTLSGIYLTAWIILITIRWVKSFVPTIGN